MPDARGGRGTPGGGGAPAGPGPAGPLRVLVVGGTGFLGAAFARALHDRGHRVAVLSRDAGKVAARFPDRSIEGREGDVRRAATLPGAMGDVDVAIQCVQFPGFPVEDPSRGRTFMEVDGRGPENVARAAAEAGVRRLVYLSGVGADPGSSRPWYRAKGIAEAAVREATPEHAVVRPSWVYGPEDRSLNLFADLVRRIPGFFPQLGAGDQRLNPVFVEDVATTVVAAAESPDARATTLEIGGPLVSTLDEVVRMLMEALDRRKPILHVPLPLALAGAAVAEWLPGQLLSRAAVRFLVQGAVADNAALRRLVPGLRLTPMPEALARYLGPGHGPD